MNSRRASHTKSANGNNKDVRNLANLGETASTSRVLNLAQICKKSAKEEGYAERPFFRHSLLNKSLLIKHTLRTSERELFSTQRRTATKIILPFDATDLRLGGRSIFVNQMGYDAFTRSYFNIEDPAVQADLQTLQALDAIPSLDPFLVREHLARQGFRPAPCYLKISEHDLRHMLEFANEEIQRLVMTAFGQGMEVAAMKLTAKILDNVLDNELDPLKRTFRLTDADFAEGMFSWRGFLYFKWRQTQLQGEIRQVVEGLKTYRPLGISDQDTRSYLEEARPRLAKKIMGATLSTRKTLQVYDKAYQALTTGADPVPFQRFLLDGPQMFYELGENIGVLSHIGSFWSYRMAGRMAHLRLSPLEFADILVDFEDSILTVGETEPRSAKTSLQV